MVRLLVFAVFACLGLVMLYVGITQFFTQRRLLTNAIPIDATITHAQVSSSTSADTDRRVERNTSTTSHTPEVRFRYELAGNTYESDLLHPTIIVRGYASRDAAAEALAPYPVGTTTTAYVDPADPGKAFLINEASAAPMVFIIVGVLIPPIAWYASKLI
jgi:hypothetical protein